MSILTTRGLALIPRVRRWNWEGEIRVTAVRFWRHASYTIRQLPACSYVSNHDTFTADSRCSSHASSAIEESDSGSRALGCQMRATGLVLATQSPRSLTSVTARVSAVGSRSQAEASARASNSSSSEPSALGRAKNYPDDARPPPQPSHRLIQIVLGLASRATKR